MKRAVPDPLFVHVWPDPILRRKADPVGAITDEIRTILDAMATIVLKMDALGIAAPQIGISKRLIVVRREDSTPQLLKLIDPVIVERSNMCTQSRENCLSFPGEPSMIVTRNVSVRIVARTPNDNELLEIITGGLLAAVFQHEIDHLDGITLADHVGQARRDMMRGRLTKEWRGRAKQAKEFGAREAESEARAALELARKEGL